MKFTGVLVALAASAPLASAVPFKLSDILPARDAAPAAAEESFPVVRSANVTARALNETASPFVPRSTDEDKTKRSFHNGIPGGPGGPPPGFPGFPGNMTFKA